jgi:hypothetical protein
VIHADRVICIGETAPLPWLSVGKVTLGFISDDPGELGNSQKLGQLVWIRAGV